MRSRQGTPLLARAVWNVGEPQDLSAEGSVMKFTTLLLAAILAATSFSAIAHGGRTDKQGCHNDKKAGTRHCH
ncbi:hypothetical protein PSCICN_31130 [Pseudomonas cichorii]|nr:hypothetical protein PSCICN_31130 [Pseudomonas cichorii]